MKLRELFHNTCYDEVKIILQTGIYPADFKRMTISDDLIVINRGKRVLKYPLLFSPVKLSNLSIPSIYRILYEETGMSIKLIRALLLSEIMKHNMHLAENWFRQKPPFSITLAKKVLSEIFQVDNKAVIDNSPESIVISEFMQKV